MEDYGTVWACMDCTTLIEHGEVWEPDPRWDMEAAIAALDGMDITANFDDIDGVETFSVDYCDVCGSGLGGARYRYAIWDDCLVPGLA